MLIPRIGRFTCFPGDFSSDEWRRCYLRACESPRTEHIEQSLEVSVISGVWDSISLKLSYIAAVHCDLSRRFKCHLFSRYPEMAAGRAHYRYRRWPSNHSTHKNSARHNMGGGTAHLPSAPLDDHSRTGAWVLSHRADHAISHARAG